MSRELQEKAEKIMKELQDSLAPLKEEIKILKNTPEEKSDRLLR